MPFLRAGLAGALVGTIDALATLGGGQGLRDSYVAVAGGVFLGLCWLLPVLIVEWLAQGRLPPWLDKTVAAISVAVIPSLASLVLAVEQGGALLVAGSVAWVLVAVGTVVLGYRRGLVPRGVSLALAVCTVPALLTLHFLGAIGRVNSYPMLAIAAAAGVWLLMIAQAAVIVLNVGGKGALPLPLSRRLLVLLGGGLCVGSGFYAVPEVYGALRWDLSFLGWGLFYLGGRGVFGTTSLGAVLLVLAPSVLVSVPLVRALREGTPMIVAPQGGQLMNDLLASLQSPAERLEALKRNIDKVPAYEEALTEHGRPTPSGRQQAGALSVSIDTVVLITIEALPYESTGYSGHAPDGLTPHMDRLAAESLRFHDAYSPASCTLLTLPALLHSQYPGRLPWAPAFAGKGGRIVRLEKGTPPPSGTIGWPVLARELPSALPIRLADLGFHTSAILNGGNTHVFDSGAGLARGFDEQILFGGRDIMPELKREVGVSDHLVANALKRLLQRRQAEKLFVWLHLYTPHVPYSQAPVSGFTGHLADIHLTDQVLGRVMKALDEFGRSESALVVLTADHGESLGTHRIGSPKMGRHGLSLQEAEVHVPLLVRAPGVAASDVRVLASGLDIAPTILSALGAKVPNQYVGEDLRWLAKTRSRPSTVFLEQWILAPGSGTFRVRWVGSIDDETRHKTLLNERTGSVFSFDLRSDPEELENRFEVGSLGNSSAETNAFAELLGWRRATLRANPQNLDRLFED